MTGSPRKVPRSARARNDVKKYLLPGEGWEVLTQRHPAVLIRPTLIFLPIFLVGGWLLAEQLELIDLRDRIYPDLPLGPPSEHLLPGT